MHYIHYTPDFIPRIADHPDPTQLTFGSEDVNLLSQIICKFNDWVRIKSDEELGFCYTTKQLDKAKLAKLEELCYLAGI